MTKQAIQKFFEDRGKWSVVAIFSFDILFGALCYFANPNSRDLRIIALGCCIPGAMGVVFSLLSMMLGRLLRPRLK